MQAYLALMAELRGIPVADQPERLSEAIYATELSEHLTRPIGQLSKGFRQRVGLAQAILDVKEKIRLCSVCMNITDQDPCRLCQDPSRTEEIVCVVEEPNDLYAIEKTGSFNGK